MAFRTYSQPVLVRPAKDARIESYVCEEDVTQGQVLRPGGTNSDEVEPSDTDGEEVYGVATQTVSGGDMVQVAGPGTVVRFSAGGSVSSGAIASHGATGEEGEVADAATGDYIAGFAHESGSDGDSVVGIVSPSGQVN